jgi:hypothetical protein
MNLYHTSSSAWPPQALFVATPELVAPDKVPGVLEQVTAEVNKVAVAQSSFPGAA